jgi:hypothetical protein
MLTKPRAILRRIRREENGIALITSVMVSGVVFILGMVVVRMAIHNTEASAYDRRRVQAIAAAEAGIDYYLSHLAATTNPQCSVTESMVGSPGRFTVTATFYDVNSVVVACPIPTGVTPASVVMQSVGTSGLPTPKRTMQAYAKLSGTPGVVFDNAGAIFAQTSATFTSQASIGGSRFSDADLYSNGTVSLASSSVIYGKVYAQGGITMQSNADIKREAWAAGNIVLKAGARIRGTATSSGGSMTLASNSRIFGGAKAAGSITGGVVDVYRSPNQTGLTAPPARTYPAFTFVSSDWTASGYTNQQTFSGATACTNAENYIKNTWTTGNLLVRILASGSSCSTGASGLTFSGSYDVKGNLAIISDGPVTLSDQARFVATPASSVYEVFVFAGLSGIAPCNITFGTNARFNPGLVTLLYTHPSCGIVMNNNSGITQGQILGGTIDFKHTAAFQYTRLAVPGTGTGGFKQDVVYKREIA